MIVNIDINRVATNNQDLQNADKNDVRFSGLFC